MGQPLTAGNLLELVVFSLDGQRYALSPSVVDRVIRMVEITPFPDGPDCVMGLINLHGSLIPALALRRLFHLPSREPELTDHLIIAHYRGFRAALAVDEVSGVVVCSGRDVSDPDEILPGSRSVKGLAKLDGDIVFIYDLEIFLPLVRQELENRGEAQAIPDREEIGENQEKGHA